MAGEIDTARPLPPPSRRRDKPQLSCNLCRKRKLRCDRGQPCDTCARRGLSYSCTYAQNNVTETKTQKLPRTEASARMQERIGQLESLVNLMMNKSNLNNNLQSSSAEPALAEASTQVLDSFGRISLENSEIGYVDSTHWTAILDGIADLKDHFEDDTNSFERVDVPPQIHNPATVTSLLSWVKPVGLEELLSAIPARHIADRLVASYFNSTALVSMAIHGPSFLRQYERFWDNQYETSIMWIGTLFGVLCVASANLQAASLNSIHESSQVELLGTQHDMEMYREKMVQSLVIGNYMKCAPYTVEALLWYLQVESFRSSDSDTGVWVLFGVVVRVAMRMGYHRDPSHSPRITPFQAEMRRRIWATITMLDVALSAQFGLPRTIRPADTDTKELSNYRDEDFDEDTAELPSPRPETEPTHAQFIMTKTRLMSILGMIADLTCSTQACSHADVMSLDKVLNATFARVPPGLRMRPLTKSVMDSSIMISHRLMVVLVYHKCQMNLHRNYLLPARTDKRYEYSRNTCIEAALQTLQYQQLIDQESQPGGRLQFDRWKMSSIVKTEFFLATSILCLDLDRDLTSNDPIHEASNRKRVIEMLRASYLIWRNLSDTSKEAKKAAEVLRVVLGKAQKAGASKSYEGAFFGARAPDISFDSMHKSPDWSTIPGMQNVPVSTSQTTGTPSLPSDPGSSSTSSGAFPEMTSDIFGGDCDMIWDDMLLTDELLDIPQPWQSAYDFPM